MEKLYKYATDNSELEITQLQSQLVKLDVSGKFTSDNIDELFLATDKIFEKFDQAYLIVNVKNFSSFPWNKRKFVYDTIDSWYKNKNVSHILIVSANSFIKMLGFLAGSFYKEIAHSFYHKESDALNAYKNLNFKSNGDINPSTIHEALESKKSSSYVEIEFYDKWEHSKSLIEVYFLKPDILYMRQVGKLSSDSVGILQNYIEKRSESCSGVRLVLDMSQCTGISRDARKRFSEHSIRINNLLRFKFFKFPAFVSSLYKIYTFINPSYDETTQMISDPEGVLYRRCGRQGSLRPRHWCPDLSGGRCPGVREPRRRRQPGSPPVASSVGRALRPAPESSRTVTERRPPPVGGCVSRARIGVA